MKVIKTNKDNRTIELNIEFESIATCNSTAPHARFVMRTGDAESRFCMQDIRHDPARARIFIELWRGSDVHKCLVKFASLKEKENIYFTISEGQYDELKRINDAEVEKHVKAVQESIQQKILDGFTVVEDWRGEYAVNTYVDTRAELNDYERAHFYDNYELLRKGALLLAKQREPDEHGDGVKKYFISFEDAQRTADALADERRRKEAKIKAEKKAKLEAMTLKELALRYFAESIHIDEAGYFSSCEDYCDDCVWVEVWTKSAPDDVRSAARGYAVKGKNKTYYYKQVDEKSLEVFVMKHADILHDKRAEEIKKLQ